MPISHLGCLALLATVIVIAVPRALAAQQPAPRDSAAADSTTHRDSTRRLRRFLNFDHIGVALGPSITLDRPGWTHHVEVRPGIAGGFFRGAGFGSRGRKGLVPAFKFDIFPKRVSIVDTVAGSGNALGSIRMRSLMAGLGWSQPVGQSLSFVVTGVVGETFNSLSSSTSKGRDAPFDVVTSPISVADAMAWEVSGRIWHRLRPNTVILAGMSYYRTRPALSYPGDVQRITNFDMVRVDLGIAFTVLHRDKKR